jgi:hypothetical protein
METALRHGGDVQAWTRKNGAFVEPQPGISERPLGNCSTVLKRVVFHRERLLIPEQLICYQYIETFDPHSLPPFLGIYM